MRVLKCLRGMVYMREQIEQSLSLREIQVDKADYPYIELQVMLIKQLEGALTDSDLNEVVPATVYRAEVTEE